MTDTTKSQAVDSRVPTHIAYQVRNREGQKGYFTHIGAAWPHKDGKGFTIRIETVPLDGCITLRTAAEKSE